MSVQTSRPRLFLFLLLLLPLLGGAAAASASRTGTLVGGTLFVGEGGRAWLGDAPSVTIELEHEGQTISVVSDLNGDYIVKLAAGTYRLKSARDAGNKPLRFSPRQPNSFKIEPGKDTRFDLMLLKPTARAAPGRVGKREPFSRNGYPPKSSRLSTYEDTRNLLFAMNDRLINRDKLAALFRVGDERITDLLQLLDDPNQEISLRSQVIIRYLGNEVGMAGLLEWYDKRKQFSVAGPVPIPLREWDYNVIHANYIGKPVRSWYLAEPYIYALALDGSPRARRALDEIIKSAGNSNDSTVAGRAIRLVQRNLPKQVPGEQKDPAKLVLDNAFFLASEDRRYASARLLGLSRAKDKALVEIYINRGRMAEEWYHVVIRKSRQGWRFFSVTQVAMS